MYCLEYIIRKFDLFVRIDSNVHGVSILLSCIKEVQHKHVQHKCVCVMRQKVLSLKIWDLGIRGTALSVKPKNNMMYGKVICLFSGCNYP